MADTNFQTGTVIASAWLRDVNTNTYTILSAVAGTNTITGNAASTVTVGYPRGIAFRFLPINNNTGAVTLNINGLGAKALTKFGADPLVANDLRVGMWAYIAYDGTQFQLINPRTTDFLFPSGILPVANGGSGIVTTIPVGQCRLNKVAANVVLQPFNGNKLTFPIGVHASIPGAGVSLAPAGLVPGTSYYIYAVQTAGVVTSLEASTTAYTQDSTSGITTKTGDTTRVLVGWVNVIAGPAFVDSTQQRLVLSWFNKRSLAATGKLSADVNRAAGAGAFSEISLSLRVEFGSWIGDPVSLYTTGTLTMNANINELLGIGINSAVTETVYGQFALGAVSQSHPINVAHDFTTTVEQWNFSTTLDRNAGTNTVTVAGATPTGAFRNVAVIQG